MKNRRILENIKSNWPFLPLAAVTMALCAYGSLKTVAKGLWAVPAVLAVVAVLFLPRLFSWRDASKTVKQRCALLSAAVSVLAGWDLYMRGTIAVSFTRAFPENTELQKPFSVLFAVREPFFC